MGGGGGGGGGGGAGWFNNNFKGLFCLLTNRTDIKTNISDI